MSDEEKDVTRKRSREGCIYCGEPRDDGRQCNKCKNYPERRYRFDPIRGLYKKFLGV